MAFGVLFVCTGNICRSPTAEALLRARLAPGAPVTAESAGTRALVGFGVDTPTAIALRELGGDCGGHAARELTPELITHAGLVLTAASSHRSQIMQAYPAAFRKTFTMREFARLGTGLGPATTPIDEEALRARVAEVAAQRGQAAPADGGADDIGDPFGASLKVARACAATIADTVDGVIAALGLSHR